MRHKTGVYLRRVKQELATLPMDVSELKADFQEQMTFFIPKFQEGIEPLLKRLQQADKDMEPHQAAKLIERLRLDKTV